MFLHMSVIHSVHRGEYLTRYTRPGATPQDQVHPLGPSTPPRPGTTPRDQVHPLAPDTPPGPGTPPRSRYTPRPGTPPRHGTSPGTRYTPQTRYTPRTRYPPLGPGTPPPPGPGTPPRAEHAGRYGQRAGCPHPTGMQSCCQCDYLICSDI